MSRVRRVAVVVLGGLLAACATRQGAVVLLPSKDGRDTAVVVTQGTNQVLLAQPFAASRLTSDGPQAYQSSAQEVQALFGAAVAAQPLAPAQVTLYFVEGKDELTEESKKLIDSVFAEIAKRPVPDVMVIGHTDKVGTDAVNDPLSRQRAAVMRQALLARGLPADNISVAGRGKRELVVPTADNVSEPRNRRVEIQVR